MNTYIKFILNNFLKSFFIIFLILFCLVIIINLLEEIDFFKELEVNSFFAIYLSLLNSPSLIIELLPFIFLISTQFFFINLYKNDQLKTFKYSGLKNLSIIKIASLISFILGIFFIVFFYNISSNFKNFYFELKSKYTSDGKYLAVITNNGLWIKDKINNNTIIINSSKIENNHLIDTFITEFNSDYEIIRNINSKKVNIETKQWILYNANVFIKNESNFFETLIFNSNFDYERIKSLFSNLSSLSFIELFELRKNYKLLGSSTLDIDMHIQKLISYPFYYFFMTIIACIIMFNSNQLKNTYLKISIGLFVSVLIYYLNNFFYVLGHTEKITILLSIWTPILILFLINMAMLNKINEK